MFKDLLVPLIGIKGDADAIDLAVSMANKLGARLVVLEIVVLPASMTSPWGVMQEVGLAEVYSTLRAHGQKNVVAMRARLEREPIRSDVRLVETLTEEPERMAALCAHYSDLALVAGSPGVTGEAGVVHGYIGGLLMESGIPVLMVPGGSASATIPPRRVVIGWKPTREATRALHDALPFLQAAEQVDLLIVIPQGGEGHGEQLGNDVATHVAQHGVQVNVVIRPAGEDTVAATLLKHAATIQADLIVVGGYGHSRLREWMLGGVTRELLGTATVPVFFSH
jgi:nucleotide-binding universal stress UspA family protein